MDINVSIEVAIGLTVMYLLLALLCTIILETFATVLGWRAKNLRTGIETLLQDPSFQGLATRFFNTPIMRSITATAGPKGPSYLASADFASALLSCIQPGKWHLGEVQPAQPGSTDIATTIGALPNGSTLKGVLTAFASEAGQDADKLRLRIAQWFDQAMERWGGIYKRSSQLWSFCIALAVVVAINADTFSVAKALWDDPAARSQILETAKAIPPEEIKDPKYANISKDLRAFPLGWNLTSPAEASKASAGTAAQGTEAAKNDSPRWVKMIGLLVSASVWIKILGLLVSALAVSLGAPFWFEVLNKLNAIRGAGRKPEPAREKKADAA